MLKKPRQTLAQPPFSSLPSRLSSSGVRHQNDGKGAAGGLEGGATARGAVGCAAGGVAAVGAAVCGAAGGASGRHGAGCRLPASTSGGGPTQLQAPYRIARANHRIQVRVRVGFRILLLSANQSAS
jgi:hypothetical protein